MVLIFQQKSSKMDACSVHYTAQGASDKGQVKLTKVLFPLYCLVPGKALFVSQVTVT